MSLNRAIIIGNLGKTPELRRTPAGQAVCDLTVATNEAYTDKGGEKRESTEWHKVVVWGRSAENCVTYLAKGRPVCVEGRLQTRAWDDREGKKRYTTEIVASRVHFLNGGRGQGDGAAASPARDSGAEPLGSRMVGPFPDVEEPADDGR
ncbi:MAG: single-stranded DNA-binding protein [Deltaproteobacteria bacterium]|nr:single-stranded DNA-binding protein [Deltaproteobacteria bacterium]